MFEININIDFVQLNSLLKCLFPCLFVSYYDSNSIEKQTIYIPVCCGSKYLDNKLFNVNGMLCFN